MPLRYIPFTCPCINTLHMPLHYIPFTCPCIVYPSHAPALYTLHMPLHYVPFTNPCMRVQCGIGVCTKAAAEYNKRGDSFYTELDFVFANVVMAIIADYMLCYLPAPTISFTCVSVVSVTKGCLVHVCLKRARGVHVVLSLKHGSNGGTALCLLVHVCHCG